MNNTDPNEPDETAEAEGMLAPAAGERPDYHQMDPWERLKRARRARVLHPRMKEIIAKVDRCRRITAISEEPECLFVKGHTGVGKSTLMKIYTAQHPRRVLPEGSVVPVIYAKVPSPASVKSLASAMLHKLGDPAAERGTTTSITGRLRDRMVDALTELVFLDEFQHFINPETMTIREEVVRWLVNFLDESKRAIVLVGLPNSDLVLDADRQIERRFAEREAFDPFGWTTPEQQKAFRSFLKTLDELMPFNRPSGFAGETTALRFFYASRGVIGYMVPIVRRAAEFAIEDGLETMDLETLAKAYAGLKWNHKLKCGNPFEAEPGRMTEELMQPPAIAGEENDKNPTKGNAGKGRATNRRVRGKRKPPGADDVLRA